MRMSGEYRIAAPRRAVWDALNDPEVLKACIPGCEELERTSDTAFAAKVKAKVGPVSARFAGVVTLSDIVAPERCTISGEGKGGAAGFAKGGAKVRLDEDGDAATTLRYEVDAKVGGKLARIGARLIGGTAKKMADDFFGSLAERIGGPAEPESQAAADGGAGEGEAAETEAAAPPARAAPDKDAGVGARTGVWVTGLIAVTILLLLVFGLG